MFQVHAIPTGKWRENCYVISDVRKDALIIDPGQNTAEIISYLRENGLEALAILNTHGHYDHVGAVAPLQKELGIPFYLHSKDHKLLKSANFYRKIFEGEDAIAIPRVDVFLDELESGRLTVGPFEIEVLATPGHTPGGVCLRIGENLFTGDTLFKGKVGRTDLPGGDAKALGVSLRELTKLSPEIRLYPGHGSATTLGAEIESNDELRRAIA